MYASGVLYFNFELDNFILYSPLKKVSRVDSMPGENSCRPSDRSISLEICYFHHFDLFPLIDRASLASGRVPSFFSQYYNLQKRTTNEQRTQPRHRFRLSRYHQNISIHKTRSVYFTEITHSPIKII